ncbi:sensor domain-containing diguanylate cyclase [Leucothrix pacifica]|uniref:diguanylate cyclase n=1 Tax=Leucothrix pacifica TaxID=1247513 RepID=A0A317C1K3_9GAMM|nr:sensor domain-containing diguanylate cyclase [Leucothrix pacifica]PWQ92061.1 hypothetical protein DKW60_23040 [Leucothrix pacifica]
MNNYEFLDPVMPGDPSVEMTAITTDQFESILNIQQKILNFIAQDRKENDILDELCTLSEVMLESSVASIMLLNPNTESLSLVSAPSIPEDSHHLLYGVLPNSGNGSCATAFAHGRPAYVNDTSTDDRWRNARDLANSFEIKSCWSMPVYNRDGRVIGTFALSSAKQRRPSTFHDRLLKMCSSAVSILLERKELRRLSVTDKLTGLWNRVKLDQGLHAQRASYSVYQETYSVMIIDIDHFKHINDNYGHNVGDTVLSGIAEVLRDNIRPRDLLGRWGGEEFMVLLPDSGNGKALEIGEEIRMAVRNHSFGLAGDLTVSIGICEVKENLRTLEVVDRADRALYRAKASGRDRVCMFYKNKGKRPSNIVDINKKAAATAL